MTARRSDFRSVVVRSVFLRLAAVCLGVGPCLCGCDKTNAPPSSTPDDYASYAELSGLRLSHHPELQAELARIVDERSTPKMMMTYRADGPGKKRSLRPRAAAGENLSQTLADLFETHELLNIQQRLEWIVPSGTFAFTAKEVADGRELLRRHARQRVRFREAIERPGADLGWQHTLGLMADPAKVDALRACVRLELLSIGGLLAEEQPAAAVDALGVALRAIGVLSSEPHLIPRLEAARARVETIAALAAVVEHPATDRAQQVRLFTLLNDQLQAWPADADAWIGERAEGLHTYEMVRGGLLLSILDDDELKRLRESKNFKQSVEKIGRSIDDDELYYLRAMREIIEASRRPYFERQAGFADLRTRLAEAARQSDYPYVAVQVLLRDFESGQRVMARDRALCEGWALLLALACDLPLPDWKTNGLTGAPYRLLKQPERSFVAGVFAGKDDVPLSIPVRQ